LIADDYKLVAVLLPAAVIRTHVTVPFGHGSTYGFHVSKMIPEWYYSIIVEGPLVPWNWEIAKDLTRGYIYYIRYHPQENGHHKQFFF